METAAVSIFNAGADGLKRTLLGFHIRKTLTAAGFYIVSVCLTTSAFAGYGSSSQKEDQPGSQQAAQNIQKHIQKRAVPTRNKQLTEFAADGKNTADTQRIHIRSMRISCCQNKRCGKKYRKNKKHQNVCGQPQSVKHAHIPGLARKLKQIENPMGQCST